MVKDGKTDSKDLAPLPIRLYADQRIKARRRMEQLQLKSIAEYIRHLIDNDNN